MNHPIAPITDSSRTEIKVRPVIRKCCELLRIDRNDHAITHHHPCIVGNR
ncbi:MAG: hypothetical protein ABW119_20880 [Candidatus Thiodiazotropha lotti]